METANTSSHTSKSGESDKTLLVVGTVIRLLFSRQRHGLPAASTSSSYTRHPLSLQAELTTMAAQLTLS